MKKTKRIINWIMIVSLILSILCPGGMLLGIIETSSAALEPGSGGVLLTFNANGGSCDVINKTVYPGEKYGALPSPVKTGYEFERWQDAEGNTVRFSTIVTKSVNHSIYAVWIPSTYKVSFSLNGGKTAEGKYTCPSKTVDFGGIYGELPSVYREGYRFVGWKIYGTDIFVTSASIVNTASNHTLTAIWENRIPTRLDIIQYPEKTAYVLGESFEPEGLILSVVFDNGENETITSGYTYDAPEFSQTGNKNILIEYIGISTTLGVSVSRGNPVSVSISKKPAKTRFSAGDEIDITGIELTASFLDGSSEIITDNISFSPAIAENPGKQMVTVSYLGAQASYMIRIDTPALSGLRITRLPYITAFNVNDELDTDGLQLTVVYVNGYERLTESGYSANCDLSTPGIKTVTVSYSENSSVVETTYNITVSEIQSGNIVYSEGVVSGDDSTVTVPISISGNTGFMGFGFSVSYNADVVCPVSVQTGDLLNNSGGSLVSDVGSGNTGRFLIIYSSAEEVASDGLLFSISFRLQASSPSGEIIHINPIVKDCFDEEYNTVDFNTGPITVIDSDSGDFNPAVFEIESLSAEVGEEFRTALEIINSGNISSYSLVIEYNADRLEFLGAESELSNVTLVNPGRITVISKENTSPINNGEIAVFHFRDIGTEPGNTVLLLSCSSYTGTLETALVCRNSVISLSEANATAHPELYSGTVSYLDDIIKIPVMISGNPGIAGITISLPFDVSVINPVSVSRGNLIQVKGLFDYNIDLVSEKITIVWSGDSAINESGELFIITLKAKEQFSELRIPILVNNGDVFSESLENIDVTCRDIYIETSSARINAFKTTPKVTAPAQKTLHTGERYQVLTSTNFDVTRSEWKSDDTSVATVNSNGVVKAVGAGTTVITVTKYGKGKNGNDIQSRAYITIIVKEGIVNLNLGEWLKSLIERFFTETLLDFLENMKEVGLFLFRLKSIS
ncbi:MAG: bacterial Ig-like domain-containing protein [Clostridia bacterium]|nr:bacterial Ig-like domain-containing protein [Clostridia bacterium]